MVEIFIPHIPFFTFVFRNAELENLFFINMTPTNFYRCSINTVNTTDIFHDIFRQCTQQEVTLSTQTDENNNSYSKMWEKDSTHCLNLFS